MSLVELAFTYTLCCPSLSLVCETFMKCGKLQCKYNFNRSEVRLVMTEHIETNQIVLYLSGGYMMHLETTWNVSGVRCQVSHVTLQPLPNRKS